MKISYSWMSMKHFQLFQRSENFPEANKSKSKFNGSTRVHLRLACTSVQTQTLTHKHTHTLRTRAWWIFNSRRWINLRKSGQIIFSCSQSLQARSCMRMSKIVLNLENGVTLTHLEGELLRRLFQFEKKKEKERNIANLCVILYSSDKDCNRCVSRDYIQDLPSKCLSFCPLHFPQYLQSLENFYKMAKAVILNDGVSHRATCTGGN